MKLHTLGIGFRHNADFMIDRPNGSGDDLLIIFTTTAAVYFGAERITVPSGSAVLFSADFHQHYGADGTAYENHWVHFDHENDDVFLRRIGLPFNTIVTVPDMAQAESVLTQLNLEHLSNGTNRPECTDLLLRLLLAKIGGTQNAPSKNGAHSAELRELRAEIYRDPAQSHSIADHPARLLISPSHFQYLYRTEFGVSCYDDVITARLDRAKYYLTATALPIKEIAQLCGYENDVHFIRQFKKRTGLTASAYRASHDIF